MDSESGADTDTPDRPSPPEPLDPDLRAFLAALREEEPETIRAVAAYTDDLATWAEREADRSETDQPTDEGDRSSPDDASEGGPLPEGVPERATVSTIDIDGTAYDYYQWREGDSIRSETVER